MGADDGPAPTIGEHEDDATIGDDDVVYRRVARDPAHTKLEPSGVRATSAAFEDRDDGMSVFLRSVMIARNLEIPGSVIEGKSAGRFAIAELSVHTLRHELGCGITRDPDPPGEPPHPCNPAHALVHLPPLGKKPLHRLRGAIARAALLHDDVSPPPD